METILVTGSSRGIGRAIAKRLSSDGYMIALHCKTNTDAAEEVLSEIRKVGGDGRILQFDISDREASLAALNDDVEKHGAYYGVVCNAGLSRDNAFPALTDTDWDDVIKTNLDGFYNVLHPLIMPMVRRKKPGRIVTISSVSGLIGNRGQVNYSAAKAGIIGASKALAVEMAKRKITVNCVVPGLIETEMLDDVPIDEILKIVPMRRMGSPREVAALVSFLCSDDAGYITRQAISVNGGMC